MQLKCRSLVAFKQVLGISNKIKHFDYKGGRVTVQSKPFHITLNSITHTDLFWPKSSQSICTTGLPRAKNWLPTRASIQCIHSYKTTDTLTSAIQLYSANSLNLYNSLPVILLAPKSLQLQITVNPQLNIYCAQGNVHTLEGKII